MEPPVSENSIERWVLTMVLSTCAQEADWLGPRSILLSITAVYVPGVLQLNS